MRRTTVWLLAVASFAPYAACDRPRTAPSGTRPSSTITVTPSDLARVSLGLKHDGQTVAVGIDSKVMLALGGEYRWDDPRLVGVDVDIDALVSDAADGGQQWDIFLLEPGTVRLATVGSPACRPTTPGCPDEERLFQVTLHITE